MNIFQVLCAVSPPQNESPNASNFMCIVPTLVITSELEYSSHLVYSVVSPAQLVSSSVALPAKLVFSSISLLSIHMVHINSKMIINPLVKTTSWVMHELIMNIIDVNF